MAVAAFSLAWTCYSASVSAVSIAQGPTAGTEAAESLENSNEMSQPLNGSLQTNYSGSEEDEEEGRAIVEGNFRNAKEGDDEEPITNEKFWFFHFTMAAGSVYMAMLLTDWGSGSATTVAEGGRGSCAIERHGLYIDVDQDDFRMARSFALHMDPDRTEMLSRS